MRPRLKDFLSQQLARKEFAYLTDGNPDYTVIFKKLLNGEPLTDEETEQDPTIISAYVSRASRDINPSKQPDFIFISELLICFCDQIKNSGMLGATELSDTITWIQSKRDAAQGKCQHGGLLELANEAHQIMQDRIKSEILPVILTLLPALVFVYPFGNESSDSRTPIAIQTGVSHFLMRLALATTLSVLANVAYNRYTFWADTGAQDLSKQFNHLDNEIKGLEDKLRVLQSASVGSPKSGTE